MQPLHNRHQHRQRPSGNVKRDRRQLRMIRAITISGGLCAAPNRSSSTESVPTCGRPLHRRTTRSQKASVARGWMSTRSAARLRQRRCAWAWSVSASCWQRTARPRACRRTVGGSRRAARCCTAPPRPASAPVTTALALTMAGWPWTRAQRYITTRPRTRRSTSTRAWKQTSRAPIVHCCRWSSILLAVPYAVTSTVTAADRRAETMTSRNSTAFCRSSGTGWSGC
mmetsp:Transcript_34826/g.102161  ORF Transcript_34826/g.102161 Transcript_34826/m.102161 type:complete len:226 (+) Transcript_34826:1074-1751(+)